MLDPLIRWSLANRPLVLALSAAFLAWGGMTVANMPVDVLPDLTAPTVTVIVEHPGLATTDMEQLVTLPIETLVNGVAGVRRVRSSTVVGTTIVWVEFDWGQDVFRARQLVTERLGGAASLLPPGISQPVLGPVASFMGEILFIALRTDVHSPIALRSIADIDVRRRLLTVPGVAQVTPIGGGRKQYQVLLSPERLTAYQVTLSQISSALVDANANASAGFLVRGGQEYLIQGVGQFDDLDDIRATVVSTRNGIPLRVGDLGNVQIGEALKRGEASFNGQLAVVIGIRKQVGVNTLALTDAIDDALDDLQASVPAGVEIHRDVFRQADFIDTAIANLREAVSYGGLLVVLAVVVFLASARASVITLFAIPFSLVGAVLGLSALGLSVNGMTIGGLAIALGELVDDAVVNVENCVRRLRENALRPLTERRTRLQVVYRASAEVRRPIAFATVIVVLVFVPLFLLGGLEGRLLRPLGFAYVIALLVSLLVALTLTPVLCTYLLPQFGARASRGEPASIRFLRSLYRPMLHWSLDHSTTVLAASVLAVASAIASFWWMGRSFLPEFQEGSLTISAVTVPGTSLEESDKLGFALESVLLSIPEVASTARRTGRAELDEHLQGVEAAEIDVRLAMGERPRDAVLEEIRDRVSLVPGTNVTIGQPVSHRIDHMLSGTRSSVAVKIFGPDLQSLRSLAANVERAMRPVPGVVDLAAERQSNVPTVSVRFRRDDLARYGLNAGAAAESLEAVFFGVEVGTVKEGSVAVPLVMRYEGDSPSNIETIRRTRIDTPSGARVPFSAIADVREDRSPNVVDRENVQRKIVVSCNVAGRDLRSVVKAIQESVEQNVEFPDGYRVEYGGQFESEARATRLIVFAGALVLLGIGALLATAFRSARDATVIMLNLPLALVGGVVGVFVAGGVLTVASLIGFITLFGVATRNGILLISHINHLAAEESVHDLRAAIDRGASERLGPILMTALSTGLALIPVALGLGETGSELHAPLALVVLFGLASATALNMLVVPAAYWRFGRLAHAVP